MSRSDCSTTSHTSSSHSLWLRVWSGVCAVALGLQMPACVGDVSYSSASSGAEQDDANLKMRSSALCEPYVLENAYSAGAKIMYEGSSEAAAGPYVANRDVGAWNPPLDWQNEWFWSPISPSECDGTSSDPTELAYIEFLATLSDLGSSVAASLRRSDAGIDAVGRAAELRAAFESSRRSGTGDFQDVCADGPCLNTRTPQSGSLTGSIDVDANGGLGYAFGIHLPPGINGLKPSLTVAYTNSRKDGPMGVGWVLSTPADIQSCVPWGPEPAATTSAMIADNVLVAEAKQRLCLGGQPMIAVGADMPDYGWLHRPASETVGEYRLERDAQERIFRLPYQAGGDADPGFELHGVDGKVSHYAEVQSDGLDTLHARWWRLVSTRDSFGNELRWRYVGNSPQPKGIDYANGSRRVEFIYDDSGESDIQVGYGGTYVTHGKLEAIQVFVDDELLWDYKFAYENGVVSNKRRLSSIRACDGDGVCIPATKFTYTDHDEENWTDRPILPERLASNLPHETAEELDDGSLAPHLNMRRFMVADLDADGRDDLVWEQEFPHPTGETGRWTLMYALSDGRDFKTPVPFPESAGHGDKDYAQFVMASGFHGKGGDSVLVRHEDGRLLRFDIAEPAPIEVGDGYISLGTADFNGDGVLDLWGCHEESWGTEYVSGLGDPGNPDFMREYMIVEGAQGCGENTEYRVLPGRLNMPPYRPSDAADWAAGSPFEVATRRIGGQVIMTPDDFDFDDNLVTFSNGARLARYSSYEDDRNDPASILPLFSYPENFRGARVAGDFSADGIVDELTRTDPTMSGWWGSFDLLVDPFGSWPARSKHSSAIDSGVRGFLELEPSFTSQGAAFSTQPTFAIDVDEDGDADLMRPGIAGSRPDFVAKWVSTRSNPSVAYDGVDLGLGSTTMEDLGFLEDNDAFFRFPWVEPPDIGTVNPNWDKFLTTLTGPLSGLERVLTGDFDGDGRLDRLEVLISNAGGDWQRTMGVRYRPGYAHELRESVVGVDLLASVEDGYGVITEINYLPASDDRVKTTTDADLSDDGCVYATDSAGESICAAYRRPSTRPVVWKMRYGVDSGSDPRESSYRYGPVYTDARTNRFLGTTERRTDTVILADSGPIPIAWQEEQFGTLVVGDALRRSSDSASTLEHEFPLAGRTVVSRTITPTGEEIVRGQTSVRELAMTTDVFTYTQKRTVDAGLFRAPSLVASVGSYTWSQEGSVANSIVEFDDMVAAVNADAGSNRTWALSAPCSGYSAVQSASSYLLPTSSDVDVYGNVHCRRDARSSGHEGRVTTTYEYSVNSGAVDANMVNLARASTSETWFNGMPAPKTTVSYAYCDPSNQCGGEAADCSVLRGKPVSIVESIDGADASVSSCIKYDEFGNMTRVEKSSTDVSESRVTEIDYDDEGLFPVERRKYSTGLNGLEYKHRIRLGHDRRWGKVDYMLHGSGKQVHYGYDLMGRRVYADLGGRQREFLYHVPLDGSSGPSTIPKHSEFESYDVISRSPGHGWKRTRYDRMRRRVWEMAQGFQYQSSNTESTKYFRYDSSGYLIGISQPVGGQPQAAPTGLYWTTFEPGPAGNALRSTSIAGAVSETERSLESDSRTVVQRVFADGETITTAARTDHDGRRIASVDGTGAQRCYEHDEQGLLSSTWMLDGRGAVGVVRECDRSQSAPSVVSIVNDSTGKVSEVHDPENGFTGYEYNGFGDLIGKLRRDDTGALHTTVFDIDELGRVRTKTDEVDSVRYHWDLQRLGRLARVEHKHGAEIMLYDDVGRLAYKDYLRLGSDDHHEYVYEYRVQDFGKLSAVTAPQAGNTGIRPRFVYEYDFHGTLYRIRNSDDTMRYWELGRENARGDVLEERLGNGQVRSYRDYYDSTGNLASIRSYLGGLWSSRQIQHLDLGYDQLDRVADRYDGIHDQFESFLYDDAGRLEHNEVFQFATGESRTNQVFYDQFGNIELKSDAPGLSYGLSNTGLNPRALIAVGADEVQYDLRGNEILRGSAVREFNIRDELVLLENGTDTITMQYDGSGARIGRMSSESSEVREYFGDLYENTQRVLEDGSTEDKHHYRVSAGGRVVSEVSIEEVSSGWYPLIEFKFISSDEKGSPSAVTKYGENYEFESMAFDAWGKRRISGNWTSDDEFVSQNDITTGFTGHPMQLDSGLIAMGARHYDPVIGRFISADPTVAYPSSTQGWSRYVYTENDPVNRFDPDGYSWCVGPWCKMGFSTFVMNGEVIGLTNDDFWTRRSYDERRYDWNFASLDQQKRREVEIALAEVDKARAELAQGAANGSSPSGSCQGSGYSTSGGSCPFGNGNTMGEILFLSAKGRAEVKISHCQGSKECTATGLESAADILDAHAAGTSADLATCESQGGICGMERLWSAVAAANSAMYSDDLRSLALSVRDGTAGDVALAAGMALAGLVLSRAKVLERVGDFAGPAKDRAKAVWDRIFGNTAKSRGGGGGRWGHFTTETNSAGGNVSTSVGKVNQEMHVAPLVEEASEQYKRTGKRTSVLTGAHGNPNGRMDPDIVLFDDDLDAFSGMGGIDVIDVTELSPTEISGLLESSSNTIGAFCHSGKCLAPFRK